MGHAAGCRGSPTITASILHLSILHCIFNVGLLHEEMSELAFGDGCGDGSEKETEETTFRRKSGAQGFL